MFCKFRKILFSPSKTIKSFRGYFVSRSFRMNLCEVVSKLESFAPISLAEKWDNVGLLVEPSGNHEVNSILLTNDLTEAVLEEAIKEKVQMILSYHPPIFTPLKKLTKRSFKERVIVRAIEEKIAIYSPHTAFDAVYGGINDWLASGLGEGKMTPLCHAKEDCVDRCTNKVVVTIGKSLDTEMAIKVQHKMCNINGVKDFYIEKISSYNESVINNIKLLCSDVALAQVIHVIKKDLSLETCTFQVQPLSKVPIPHTGTGRLYTLASPLFLDQLIRQVKKHLQLEHIRLAIGQDCSGTCKASDAIKVSSVAICAGSGGNVLKGIKADVLLTGEMSHHDVLEAVSNGCHVILCEHSNTERGFLKVFQDKLNKLLDDQIRIVVSSLDKEPLKIV